MSNKQDEYTRWQNGFNAAYRIEPNKEGFRRKMAEYHPGIDPDLSEEKQLSKIKERMSNATRGLKDENGEIVHYDRSPYLEDLFALCKAKGLSPNDILLGSQFVLASSFLSFVDIYDLLKSTDLGNDLFECFDISKQEFYGHKPLPDDPIFLILFRKNILLRFSKMFTHYTEVKETVFQKAQPEQYCFESEIDDEYSEDHRRLVAKVKTWLVEKSNDDILKYWYSFDLFQETCVFSAWTYDVNEHKFTNGDFELINLNYSNRWSRKRHLMATLCFALFDCFIATLDNLHSMYLCSAQEKPQMSTLGFCKDYITGNEQALEFCKHLHKQCYIAINQSVFVDIPGNLYPTEVIEEDAQTQHESTYKRRMDNNEPKRGCVPSGKSSSSVM